MNFQEACQDGNLQLVQKMIEHGVIYWNSGLYGACLGGHLQIAEMMIQKGANCVNSALCGACARGHLQLVQLMIDHGAKFWDDGLKHALDGEHLCVMRFMIEKGATGMNILSFEHVHRLLELGMSLDYFETYGKFRDLFQEIKIFRENIRALATYGLLLPELLNLVSEYSLK